jgi:hypothetical protein
MVKQVALSAIISLLGLHLGLIAGRKPEPTVQSIDNSIVEPMVERLGD